MFLTLFFIAPAFYFLTVLFPATLAAQPRTQSMSLMDTEKIKRDIQSVLTAQIVAWNQGDLKGFMNGYHSSDSTLFITKQIHRGSAAVLQNYLKRYPSRAAMGSVSFAPQEWRILSERHAIVVGQFQLKRVPENSAAATEILSGYFTLVFEQFADGWKIILDHTSSN